MTDAPSTEMNNGKRVAVIGNASGYVGPDLAKILAARGHDLVLGDPAPGLVDLVGELGAESWVVDNVLDLAEPTAAPRLLDMAMDAYGRVDSAVFSSGAVIGGSFLKSEPEHLQTNMTGNMMAPYRALRAFAPAMVAAGSGQILVMTSAAGLKVSPGVPLYSATRAGANMLVKNVAAEVAPHGVQVNAIGTNFMDFPVFLKASGATDPDVRAKIERRVPLRRLGSMEEFAHFCAVFVDGTSGFQTGQTIGYDGGWSAT
jgi:NAD(P)-dependent dehydrogenase (short-subunit alcohol dehydrogenase family)